MINEMLNVAEFLIPSLVFQERILSSQPNWKEVKFSYTFLYTGLLGSAPDNMRKGVKTN
jgi:hypothetical protein